MDGSTPTTAGALHGESRGYSEVEDCLAASGDARDVSARERTPAEAGAATGSGKRPATDPVTVRGIPREPGRVYLMAPARWKSADSPDRRRSVAPPVVMPAPAQWVRSRCVPSRLPARRPAAERWLLPPTWPLDGWHVSAVAGLRRVVGARIVPWARACMPSWPGWASAHRHRLAAGIAMGAIAGAALVLLRLGAPHPDAGSTPARAMAAAPASATHASSLPLTPVPVLSLAATAPASASTVSPAVRSGPAETDRKLLSDVSTMDLMMPIKEPDLDITSRQSLWSQVGKASGVDPLLLYSVALVESKALYPDGRVAPTPWLFRVNDHLVRGDRHDVQLAMAAASQFGSPVQDVGIMQVYYPMHRDAVRDPLTLLDPRTNITVGAKILRDGMRRTRDRVMGVGYYHSHTPSLARGYGTAVLTVYDRLKAQHRKSARQGPVAR